VLDVVVVISAGTCEVQEIGMGFDPVALMPKVELSQRRFA
jgi:hypothetical protein